MSLPRRFLVGLVLVDLPVLLAVLVAGVFVGFRDAATAVTDYRMEHPWTFLPSLAVLVLVIRLRRRQS